MTSTAPRILELALPGLTMKALMWGPPDGRLVLCLHGFPDSAWSWRRLAPLLAEAGLRVVAPFTRGYWPSQLPADNDYTVAALMSDAAECARALNAGDDAVLVGHDWGSLTCNGLAAYPGSPFASHISLSVPPIEGMRPRQGRLRRYLRLLPRQMRMSWYIIFFQLPFIPERVVHRLIAKLWRDWSPAYREEADVANALAALPDTKRRAAALSYYRAIARNRQPAAAHAYLHTYRHKLPCNRFLYLHGADDGALNPDFVDVLAEALAGKAEAKVLPAAGHFLQIEQPQAVASEILRFVSQPQADANANTRHIGP